MENEPKRGDRRQTVTTLACGQPRPYADTIRHVRVVFEHVPYTGPLEWQPDNPSEERVRDTLRGMYCGFTEFVYPPADRKPTAGDYFTTRLDWLRNTAPGVWEFHTTSAFTD